MLQDPLDDIKGAMEIGMKGILVKTGKYRSDITAPQPIKIADNFSSAVEFLIDNNFNI